MIYNEKIITEKLTELGLKESDILLIVQDVSKIIFSKFLQNSLQGLTESEKKILENNSSTKEEVEELLKGKITEKNKKDLTQENLTAITNSVWDDYFAFMASK